MKNNDNSTWVRTGGLLAQANIRLVVLSLLTGGFYLMQRLGIPGLHVGLAAHLAFVTAMAYAFVTYYLSARQAEPQPAIRMVTLVADIAVITVIGAVFGPFGLALFPLYLLITLGYGLSNGEQTLHIAAGLSSAAFALAYLFNPAWDQPVIALGLLVSLFYLPLMLARSGRLQTTQTGDVVEAEVEEFSRNEALTEISHELRQQITEVITSTDRLMQQDMSPRRKVLTRSIIDNSSTALRLVKEVDEYARLSSGQHHYDANAATLIGIIRDVNNRVADEADKKHLSYEVVFHPTLLGYYQLCQKEVAQVLYHLLGNAIKYTQQGYVRLSVSPSRSGKIRWLFDVADSGIGIEESQQSRVFEPFMRSQSGRDHEVRGLGLGATIARLLVEGMGGSIGLHSKENEGSTFWFELPVEPITRLPEAQTSPFNVCLVAASHKERKLFDALAQQGVCHIIAVTAEDLGDLDAATTECVVFGEYVSNHQLIQVLERFTGAMRGNREIPVLRFQRLQPDDMLIYSYRKSGDMIFLPNSVRESELVSLLSSVLRHQLPLRESTEAAAEKHKLSVLIADGHTVSRDILATLLVNRGHQIYMARNPLQTHDIVSGIKLDLILLDPELVEANLIQALRHSAEQGQSVRCLLLGRSPTQDAMPAGLEAYVDGYLEKPFTSAAVYKAIENLMGTAASMRRISAAQHDISGINEGRERYFSNDRKLMNIRALGELEKVDNANVLVQRSIDQYLEDNSRLMLSIIEACNRADLPAMQRAAGELAAMSEQIGLERLATTLSQIQSVKAGEFPAFAPLLRDKLEALSRESRKSILEYQKHHVRR